MKVFVLVCAGYSKGPLKSVLGVSLCWVGSLRAGVCRRALTAKEKCSEGHGGPGNLYADDTLLDILQLENWWAT